MTITYTIPGTTLLDQLAPTTLDGLPNDNAQDNCVATSIAEALHILTGRDYDGDEVKDAVYGSAYVGFEAAAHYVAYCAREGVDLVAHNDAQAGLVATIHTEVAAAHPVIVTMPSQWGTAPVDPVHPSGSTHVGVAVGLGAGEIRVMNPWHAFYQDQSDAWWQARLCEGQVWVMSKKVSAQPVTTAQPGGATPFYGLTYTSDPQVWHCPATNHSVGHGFLDFYQNVKGPHGQSGTQILGLPKSDEYDVGAIVKQDFERGRLVYDASKSDPWQITVDVVSDASAAALTAAQDALAAANAHLATANALVTSLQAQLQAAQTAASAQSADSATLAALRAALKTVLG